MPQVRSQNIVGRWCPSAGATGFRLLDRSGRRNHGTLTNMDPPTDWLVSTGKGVLDFDGTNDRVDFSVVNLSTLGFAVSFWAQQRGTSAIGMPIGDFTRTDSSVWFRSASYLGFRTPVGMIEFNTITTFTAFKHYLITSSSSTGSTSTINVYLDGVFIASQALASTTFSINALGSGYASNSFPFPGVLDDVILFNCGLTASDVRLIYQRGRGYGIGPSAHRSRRLPTAGTNRRRRVICGGNC